MVPTKYKGDTQNYVGDIAILVTTTKFNFSRRVQPICMDWGQNFEADLYNSKKNDSGFVKSSSVIK